MLKEFVKHAWNVFWAGLVVTMLVAGSAFALSLWAKVAWAIASYVWLF
jgi:hypothetical protein